MKLDPQDKANLLKLLNNIGEQLPDVPSAYDERRHTSLDVGDSVCTSIVGDAIDSVEENRGDFAAQKNKLAFRLRDRAREFTLAADAVDQTS